MPLTINLIDDFNPFDWDKLCCPVCGKNNFTSVNHAGVYCDCCNARFVVRDTAGDPGCVIDCFITKEQGAYMYAPAYKCLQCNDHQLFGRIDGEGLVCPLNMHHGDMAREQGISSPWTPRKGLERYCLILKLGDYISGWMPNDKPHDKVGGATQKQWDKWQETIEQSRIDRRNARHAEWEAKHAANWQTVQA